MNGYLRKAPLFLCSLALIFTSVAAVADTTTEALLKRLEAQEARIAELEKALGSKGSGAVAKSSSSGKTGDSEVDVGFKKGFYIKQKNDEGESFSMKINSRMQFRYTGFSRKDDTFTFDNGRTGTQRNINDFEIERGRLEFKGHFLDPRLQYYLNLDFDTDDNHDVKAHDFWFNYVVNDDLDVYFGKAFVPGSREWIDGSTTTHLADRSMATSFFRPDRSLGIWAIGEALPGLHYRAMLANGFKTTDLDRDDIDDQFTYAATIWSDLVGDYGSGRADLKNHDELAVRAGTSFTYSPIDESYLGDPIGEASAVRLSDGAKLNSAGSLADGVTVDEYDLYLYAVDLSMKYRGWSMNSEYYYRSISDIEGTGGELLSSFDDQGFYIDTGYFFIPAKLEGVLRYSFVDGEFSDGSEYAGGFNYYINGTHKNKLTFDVALLEDSPISSSGPNYEAGMNGVMFRTQWQIAF